MSEVPQSEGDIKGSPAETEGQTPRLEDLQPGDVIRFADITELTAFEDIIAGVVEGEVGCHSLQRPPLASCQRSR
jgi:hypothetical protein